MLLAFYILAIGLLLGSCRLEFWRACWFLGWFCRWAFWAGHCRLWVRIVPSVLLPDLYFVSCKSTCSWVLLGLLFWQYVLSITHSWSVWSALSQLSIPKGALELCLDFRISVLHWVCPPRDLWLEIPKGFMPSFIYFFFYLFTSDLPASCIQRS